MKGCVWRDLRRQKRVEPHAILVDGASGASGMTQADRSSYAFSLYHEAIEERAELRMPVERQKMRNILIWPHDHHAAALAVDVTQTEDVTAAFQIGAEHFLVVAESVASLPRQEKGWHRFDGQLAMTLLKNRTNIDHRVDVRARRSIFPDRRLRCLGEKIAQGPNAGVRRGGIFSSGKSEDAPAAIRLDCVTKFDRLRVRQADHRRGMKAHPDCQTFGEMLISRFAGDERRTVAGGGSRGVAPVLDEISLRLSRVELRPGFF